MSKTRERNAKAAKAAATEASKNATTNPAPAAPVNATSAPASNPAPKAETPATPAPKPEVPMPAPVAVPKPAPKPETPVAPDEEAPKWFKNFAGNWDKKHDEFDLRLKKLEDRAAAEDKAKAVAEAKEKAKAVAEETGDKPEPKPVAEPKDDADPKPDAGAKPEPKSDPKPEPAPEPKPEPETKSGELLKQLEDNVEAADDRPGADKFRQGWRPAVAWRYRYWNSKGEPRWGGPLLSICSAIAAAGGIRDDVQAVNVWVDGDLRVRGYMTPEEVSAFPPV